MRLRIGKLMHSIMLSSGCTATKAAHVAQVSRETGRKCLKQYRQSLTLKELLK